MDVLGESFQLKGMMHCVCHNFTVALKKHNEWVHIDDFCVSVRSFLLIEHLFNSFSIGCASLKGSPFCRKDLKLAWR